MPRKSMLPKSILPKSILPKPALRKPARKPVLGESALRKPGLQDPVSRKPVLDQSRPRTGSGVGFLVVAGVLWGTGGLTGSLLARHTGLDPLAVAAYRLGGGGLLLVALMVLTRRPLPRGRAAHRRIVALGGLAAVFQSSYFAAVALVGVSLATLLTIGASPLLVLVAEGVLGRRRVGPAALGTAALAVAGLGLLVGVPETGRHLTTLLAGGGFALLAAAGFGTMTLLQARPAAGLDDLAATGWAFTLGAALLAPVAAMHGGLRFAVDQQSLGLVLTLAVGPTAIAYAAYFRGLRTAPAGTGALMALLEPLVGAVLAWLVLGDRLGPAGLAGAGLLVTALLTERHTRTAERTLYSRSTASPQCRSGGGAV
jgi:DME family drug/metabolite transporter